MPVFEPRLERGLHALPFFGRVNRLELIRAGQSIRPFGQTFIAVNLTRRFGDAFDVIPDDFQIERTPVVNIAALISPAEVPSPSNDKRNKPFKISFA